jgi:hypothetical protein
LIAFFVQQLSQKVPSMVDTAVMLVLPLGGEADTVMLLSSPYSCSKHRLHKVWRP